MEKSNKTIHFEGWHGTDEALEASICSSNFQMSEGEHHWLGSGVYFFMKGIGNPQEHARNWVCSEAYKKKNLRYIVLKTNVQVSDDVVLDLRDEEALELFNEHRRIVLAGLRKAQRQARWKSLDYMDGKVIDHLKACIGIQLVIQHFYVQFLRDRIQKIRSRVPNCTFLCASNPQDCIKPAEIPVVERGNTYNLST